MLQVKPAYSSQLQLKTAAMRRLTLLVLLLMMTLGLDRQGIGLSNPAAAASAPREAVGVRARPVYEYATDHQTKAFGGKNGSNKPHFAGTTNAVEAKRLKLIFLIMMSQGQTRGPSQ